MAFDTVNTKTTDTKTTNALASAIYSGTVRHRRYSPKSNAFSYRVFMVYLDLQEIDQVFSQSSWWSYQKKNLASLQRKDFLDGSDKGSLYDGVADLVERETGLRPPGPIRMLTNLRYFNFIINPITCYYCFDKSGQYLETIVAEVTNTPWRQRCHYVLSFDKQSINRQRLTFSKTMHVSPFQPMDLEYHWRGKTPSAELFVHIDVSKQSKNIFDATMMLKRQAMTEKTMNAFLFRYPWMTLQVFAGIYWQALKLAIKRIPYFSNPGPSPETNKPSNLSKVHEEPLNESR
ncbi:MAG: DUF1365 domain-containing protein [Pseudomonadota bacterium]